MGLHYSIEGVVTVTDDNNPNREALVLPAGLTPAEIEAAITEYLATPD